MPFRSAHKFATDIPFAADDSDVRGTFCFIAATAIGCICNPQLAQVCRRYTCQGSNGPAVCVPAPPPINLQRSLVSSEPPPPNRFSATLSLFNFEPTTICSVGEQARAPKTSNFFNTRASQILIIEREHHQPFSLDCLSL
jgi:hypothetical protein